MFMLPTLSYAYDALHPYVDAKTMEIHLTMHHQAYIDNLNKAIAQYPGLQGWSVEQLLAKIESVPLGVRTAVRNYGGGHYNHTLFWQMMAPGSTLVQGKLYQDLFRQFGSFVSFQDQFETVAKTRFGSGWAWLVMDSQGKLQIYSTANQDAPLMTGDTPLLGLDVWEHAYYLQYQSRRSDYITAWWSVVNWEFVEDRYRLVVG